MPQRRNGITLGIWLAIAGLLLSAMPATAEPVKIRYAWIVVPGEIAPLMAATGAAKHAGQSYVPQDIHFQASPPMITALAAGEIDLALLGYSSLASAVSNANLRDLRIVLDDIRDGVDGYYSNEYFVLNDSGIKTVADLKGKVAAINAVGAGLDIALRMILQRNGLQPGKDVTIIEAALPNMGAMLIEHKTDLAAMVVPFSLAPDLRAKAHPLFTQREAAQGVTEFAFYVAKKDFIDKNRAAMVDFIEDYLRALRWFYDPANRDATLKIVSDFTKLPRERFADWVYTKSKDMFRDPAGQVDARALQANLDAQVDTGFVKERLTATAFIDGSLAEEANRRLGAK